MPFNPFKDAATKAEEDFSKAYDKGVNLGPQKWQDAANSFSNAAKHFAEAGNDQKSKESYALSFLFYALVTKDATAWEKCGKAMAEIGGARINVGFMADSGVIAQQAQMVYEDLSATKLLDGNSSDVTRVSALKGLAQKYFELVGSDLVVWKLMKEEIDPQRRAYYLLGLASLVEANSVMESDPRKSVSLLSEAVTHFELAGIDPMNLRSGAQNKSDRASKVAKCWFCGREVQGMGYHYVELSASISAYTKKRYSGEVPQSIIGESIVACESCSSSIKNVADIVAKTYYDRAMAETQEIARRLEARITALEAALGTLRSRVNATR